MLLPLLMNNLLEPVAAVVVCTNGVWSVTIFYAPCDDFRVTIDGPAADQVKVSTTIELEE